MERIIPGRQTSLVIALVVFTFGCAGNLIAQESPIPSPSPSPTPTPAEARKVRITFLPPPVEGTISLGIYDAKGKLVRVLHREAELEDFNIGNDSLSTTWDGKNDTGETCPAGKYSARGFAVGELDVEGRGFFFNDWITRDDSPRIRHIRGVKACDNELVLEVDLVTEGLQQVRYDQSRKVAAIVNGLPCPETFLPPPANMVAALVEPVMAVVGKDDTRWVIDHVQKDSEATELKQFSASGEFVRRLGTVEGEPRPRAVAASIKENKIYLLEENGSGQRTRALSLGATKTGEAAQPVSEWKVEFEKKIVAHHDFSVVDGKLVAAPPPNAKVLPPTVAVKLQPNPLANDERTKVDLTIGFDAAGSFLATADGLPLCTISETTHLVRAVIVPADQKTVDVYQDDGSVVEQFRVTDVDAMMAFDCGEIQLK